MARQTFQGPIRTYAGAAKEDGVTPVPLIMSAIISFDPTAGSATAVRIGTSATTGAFFVLPRGAVPLYYVSLGGATGGTNPTVDIGTAASAAGFFDEADADTKGTVTGANGALVLASGITAVSTVTGRVGASAATGGTHSGIFVYTVVDDGFESA